MTPQEAHPNLKSGISRLGKIGQGGNQCLLKGLGLSWRAGKAAVHSQFFFLFGHALA